MAKITKMARKSQRWRENHRFLPEKEQDIFLYTSENVSRYCINREILPLYDI